MQPVLFDSSIYITALRAKDAATLSLRRLAGGAPVWLSSVVLEELYAGVSARNGRVVERLERDFDKAGRIVVPNLGDWTQTHRGHRQRAGFWQARGIPVLPMAGRQFLGSNRGT